MFDLDLPSAMAETFLKWGGQNQGPDFLHLQSGPAVA